MKCEFSRWGWESCRGSNLGSVRSVAHLFAVGCTMILALGAGSPSTAAPGAVIPLARAHAHNDYLHPRPMLDALDAGFTSVEADI